MVIAGLISLFLVICLVAGAVLIGVLAWPGRAPTTAQEAQPQEQHTVDTRVEGDVIVLVARVDPGQEQLTAYIFNLEDQVLNLTDGTYYAEMLQADGRMQTFQLIFINAAPNEWVPVDFAALDSKQLPKQGTVEQMESLVSFLIAVDDIRLTYYEIVSGNYEHLMFDPAVEIPRTDEARLMETFEHLGERDQVLDAAEAFITRASSATASLHGQFSLARPATDEPAEFGIMRSIGNLFGVYEKELDIASQDLVAGIENLSSPVEKQEVLRHINEVAGINVNHLDEFVRMLHDGEVKNPVVVRSHLLRAGEGYFAGSLQDLTGTNRPDLENAHRIGGELIKHGADLNIRTIKYVLERSFPGISRGFGYAEKIDKFTAFVRDLYRDPAGTLGDALLTAAEETVSQAIKDELLDQLLNNFPYMTLEDADYLADNLVDHAEGVRNSLLDNIDAMDRGTADSPPGEPGVDLDTERIIDEYGTEVIYIHANGVHCDEAESGYPFRWAVDLAHYVETNNVQGVVKFHACPMGGRVLYRLVGEANPDGTFTLLGEKRGGGGDLMKDALDFVNFTFDPRTGTITPNFTP